MKFSSKRADEVEIAIIPMVDIMLLLLIFFMVTTTFQRDAEIQIDLPEAKAQSVPKENFVVEIVIDNQGRYFVNQQRLKDGRVETLLSALKLTIANNTKPHVIISSDRSTPYQAVVTAMDAVRQAGLNKFSLTTKQTSEEK
ncbi:MAG: biopolymer transporter ExbD [Gammaproteobacteria bacterium]|nr:biopolymer transporter ExbD [Gammaproteobacteria bacterium]